eukprot:TRINITY_DN19291_c0_g1_i1.p1 TRINITY_DN19291_c0_g1~~TRINITY_DN19291_c0_g1_i1.p1  ORF type:complete len:179 (+),score=43.63 TRINITY_DN19291_c0_g1_i1:45-539(+)
MVDSNLKNFLFLSFLCLFPLIIHASRHSLLLNEEDLSRSSPEDLLNAVLQAKRAGFIGMRGKKNFPQREEDVEDFGELEGKRGEFVGMRGKKILEDSVVYGNPHFLNWPRFPYSSYKKRRPEFLGMRGKKSGFVGMRGEKKNVGEDLTSTLDSSPRRIYIAMRA